jgi:penicillin amidase
MAQSKNRADITAALDRATVNFNCFYATASGDIGFRYTGIVPVRAASVDPRFPALAAKGNEWSGKWPMPRAENPRSGLIANWNNKPVSWWPNSDTPVWGRIFRNTELLDALQGPKLTTSDLERAAWTIARRDETWRYFKPFVEKVWQGTGLEGFDGWMLDGSSQAQEYRLFLDDLREELFLPTTGNFIAPDNFRTIAQPSVMLKALEGKTKVDYLKGRHPSDIVRKAIEKSGARMANSNVLRFVANPIPVPGQPPIPYSNRGTYIQVVEVLPTGPEGRNIVTPGVAESGEHSLDQVHLARAWMYKAMRWR